MKALQFSVTVPQFLTLKALGSMDKKLFYQGTFATVRLVEVAEPHLPSPDWVKVKTAMCGMCGSDVNLILLKDSPTASPFTSFPCTLGHEVSGEVVEVGKNVSGLKMGDRITIAPYLSCSMRNIEKLCSSCRAGRPANCENFAEGSISPGMFTGICHDTGGGFARYFVAHKDQVFKLPEGVSYQEGAMMEPLGVSLQAVLDTLPDKDDKVLVIGAGVIGNLIIQSIRALGIGCYIAVVEPSPFHAEWAKKAGADEVITDGDILNHTVSIAGATAYKPMIGRQILMGGFSKIFDAVASRATLDDSMRALATGGTLSVVGIGKEVKLDLTPLWLKLQTIKGAYSTGFVNWKGKQKHAFEIALELVKQKKIRLGPLATHTFALDDYKEMIEVNLHKGKHQAMKTMASFS
ncbi:MAG: zinc-binding dehydrogenase [Chloroflexi bacterium]|nr:zinc-binding dehydrogenase [Chloroflexota bacterium]MBM3173258.1 zinc-binding dehydrogenase [Chloroflexota bacterium]MBM3174877.1 zinc-binding dehydrogenase [Chloroflexota bacterium]MBM4450046.1 zinc-binding dehydrogenase [Chloroflexota bacterium]